MGSRQDQRGLGVLYEEHMVLGASFGPSREPLRYVDGEETLARESMREGALLCDASTAKMLLLGGACATSYATTACARPALGVGRCGFGAVLTGDGCVASIPLLARTGDNEYVLVDSSARSEVLEGWLSFLAGIEQDGVAPFDGLQCEDVSQSHVVLGLAGAKAADVLADYTNPSNLPPAGHVRSCMLDRIPCIVMRLDGVEVPTYVLLVPPHKGRALWRSLLSFAEVVPVGLDAMRDRMHRMLSWSRHLSEEGRLRIDAKELANHGLVRHSADYVGARGLTAAEEGSAR